MKITLVFRGLCKRQMEKILTRCVGSANIIWVVKVMQHVSRHRAIEGLEYLKANLILAGWLMMANLQWQLISWWSFLWASVTQHNCNPLKFVGKVVACFDWLDSFFETNWSITTHQNLSQGKCCKLFWATFYRAHISMFDYKWKALTVKWKSEHTNWIKPAR